MIRKLLPLLLALLLVVAPAAASTYEINQGQYYKIYHDWPWLLSQGDRTDFEAASGEINLQGSENGLWYYYLGLNPDSDVQVNWTTYGGLTGSADITITQTGTFDYDVSLTVDGVTETNTITIYTGFLLNPVYFEMYPARNLSDENEIGILYHVGGNTLFQQYPIRSQPIQKVTFASSDTIDGYATTGDALAVDGILGYVQSGEGITGWFSSLQELIGWVTSFGMAVFPVIETLIFWFNLIFIQNIVLTAVLYVLGTLALSIDKAHGDPFRALQQWWRWQMKLWEFIQRMVEFVINLAEKIKNIIWPV